MRHSTMMLTTPYVRFFDKGPVPTYRKGMADRCQTWSPLGRGGRSVLGIVVGECSNRLHALAPTHAIMALNSGLIRGAPTRCPSCRYE